MKNLKRRDFLAGGLVGLGMGALAACEETPAFTTSKRKSKTKLRMVTTWPKNFPGLGASAERVAQEISKASDGTLEVKVFAAGELVPALESFDAVSQGAADLYHGSEYYWQGKTPAFNFFTAIPFGMTATEFNAWIYSGGGQAAWDKLSAKFNIKPFIVANTGTQMGGWFNKPITSRSDLRGLKIRAPGLGGEIYRQLGATPVTLPGSEIFPAMQSGKIDAAEWVGPWNDLTFGFQQLARYCYWPGFHEPSAAIALGINLSVWNKLSPQHQAIIENVARGETTYSYSEYTWQNAVAFQTLKERYKVNFRPFPQRLMDSFYRASQKVLANISEKDADTKLIYDLYLKAQANLDPWTKVAEFAILDLRNN